MAGKTPGTPRKSSSRKSATKKTQPVTPISQGDATEKPVAEFSEVEINSTEKTVTPISQGTGKSAEAKKYDSGIYEEIRRRAYELYEERGRQHGFHQEDWSRAETEVLSRFKREKSA